MSTRLRRPSPWRQLLVATVLIAIQAYMAWSALEGDYGVAGRKRMQADIESLKVQSGALGAEIDSFRHRIALFDPKALDPDILTEKARALLSMAETGDMVVMVDPTTGKLPSGYGQVLTGDQSTPKIEKGID